MSTVAAEQSVGYGTIDLMMMEEGSSRPGLSNSGQESTTYDSILVSLTSHSEQHGYPAEVPKKCSDFSLPSVLETADCLNSQGFPSFISKSSIFGEISDHSKFRLPFK